MNNKDWDNFVESLDDKTKKALDDYDEMMFKKQTSNPIFIGNAKVAEELNRILKKDE